METYVSIIMSAKAHTILQHFNLVAKQNKKESENSYTTTWREIMLGFWFLEAISC
jgi:hypothetical protein